MSRVPRALPSATQPSPFRRQLDRLAKGSARGSRAALGVPPKASFLIPSFAELERFRRDAGIRTRAAYAPQTNLPPAGNLIATGAALRLLSRPLHAKLLTGNTAEPWQSQ